MRAFHFISETYALSAIRDQRLKISRFDDLNDPFELYAAELSNKEHRHAFESFKEVMAQRFGLLCFSKSWRNPLMWSHYADRHRGVALEFEVSDECINRIQYNPSRLILGIDKKLQSTGLNDDDMKLLLTTKFKNWEYEKEIRVFIDLNDPPESNGLHFSNFDNKTLALKGIILGPLSSLTEEKIAAALRPGQTIQLTTSRLAFQSYSVVKRADLPTKTVHALPHSA